MINDLIDELLKCAKSHRIIVKFLKMPKDMKSMAFIKLKLIIINVNCTKKALPFKIAHELSHVLLESDNLIFSANSISGRFTSENRANELAIHLLVKLYFKEYDYTPDNIQPIMTQLNLPPKLLPKTKRIVKKILWNQN